MPDPATKRLFLCIKFPRELNDRLSGLQSHLMGESWQVSWSPPEQFHLTVHFLGKTPERVIPDLEKELKACVHRMRPFEISAGGLGVFPTVEEPRVLWAGVEDSHGQLKDIFDRTYNVLNRYRLFKIPTVYTPHITLGRVRDLKNWDGRRLEALRKDWKRLGRLPVERVHMFESLPGIEGTRHLEAFSAGLGGE